MKRKCQHAEDVADKATWCEEDATVEIVCGRYNSVFQCDEHFDPEFKGWTKGGTQGEPVDPASMKWRRNPEGFEWSG